MGATASMTMNPCYNDGKDCPKRYVGCKTDCEKWHEWLAIHEAKKEAIRRNKYAGNEADEFARDRTNRLKVFYSARYQQEKRSGKR